MIAADGETPAKFLGPRETEIMDLLWAADRPLTGRTVLELLNQRRARPLAYTTVATVLKRLAEREIVSRERTGRRYLYRPLVHDLVDLAVQSLIRDHGAEAVDYFVDRISADLRLLSMLKRRMWEINHGRDT